MKWYVGGAASAVLLAVLLIATTASNASLDRDSTDAADCFGLACGEPGDPNYVPEAQDSPQFVDQRRDLTDLGAGFYEYEGVPDPDAPRNQTTVSYVAPAGSFDEMPASVQDLEFVQDLRDEFEDNNVLVISPSAISVEPTGVERKRRETRRREPGEWCAPTGSWCLFKGTSFTSGRLFLDGSFYKGLGWLNLNHMGDGSFNNNVESMANNRLGIGKLARDTNGNGIQHCSESWSDDSSLGDEPIGNNLASSFKVTEANNC